MAKDIDLRIRSPQKSVMFLWRSHNKANARLHGDASEDPQHLKVPFPTNQMCPKCYGASEADDWVEDEVYKFLIAFYGAENIVMDSELLVKADVPTVHMQDLESALQYSLRQEIAVNKLVNEEKMAALKEYVHVLAKVDITENS